MPQLIVAQIVNLDTRFSLPRVSCQEGSLSLQRLPETLTSGQSPNLLDKLLGLTLVIGLGHNPHNRLGIARPELNPSPRQVDPNPIPGIDGNLALAESSFVVTLDGCEDRFSLLSRAGKLGLDHMIARDLADQLADGLA